MNRKFVTGTHHTIHGESIYRTEDAVAATLYSNRLSIEILSLTKAGLYDSGREGHTRMYPPEKPMVWWYPPMMVRLTLSANL